MKLFVKGDIDGFFGLALDNLVQVLLIEALMTGVLGFPRAFVYSRVLPGVAVSLIFGNLYYSWQAKRLARKTGRKDHCALPYGINTVSLSATYSLSCFPPSSPQKPPVCPNLTWRRGKPVLSHA